MTEDIKQGQQWVQRRGNAIVLITSLNPEPIWEGHGDLLTSTLKVEFENLRDSLDTSRTVEASPVESSVRFLNTDELGIASLPVFMVCDGKEDITPVGSDGMSLWILAADPVIVIVMTKDGDRAVISRHALTKYFDLTG